MKTFILILHMICGGTIEVTAVSDSCATIMREISIQDYGLKKHIEHVVCEEKS